MPQQKNPVAFFIEDTQDIWVVSSWNGCFLLEDGGNPIKHFAMDTGCLRHPTGQSDLLTTHMVLWLCYAIRMVRTLLKEQCCSDKQIKDQCCCLSM